MRLLRRGHERQGLQEDQPARAIEPASTAEEAEITITRLLAEWELRLRRARPEGSSTLLNQTDHPEAQATRERIVQQIAALGPAALEPLLRILRPMPAANGLKLRQAAIAALALGRMGNFRAAPALLAALRDQRERAAPVRAAAATALGELKAEAAATLYEVALARQSQDDWQAQLRLLGTLRLETVVEALVEALRDPAPEVRAAAANACIDLCLAEPPPALFRAGAGPTPRAAGERVEASPALSLAVEPLIETLKDANAQVRANAATALGWIGDQRAAAPLAKRLKDPDERCRAADALALGMLRSPLALRPLARTLGDASAAVRQQVATSLGEVGDPVTIGLLIDTLSDEEEALEVRAAAARALGGLHLPQALPVLQDLLGDPEPALRIAAIEALARLGFGRIYRLLAPLLWRDPDRAVRHAAARAVAQLAQARQSRARWRLRLALRVARQARQEALAILEEQARRARHALRE